VAMTPAIQHSVLGTPCFVSESKLVADTAPLEARFEA
jgi:hypothetical protein